MGQPVACLLCAEPVPITLVGDGYDVRCERCGRYSVSDTFVTTSRYGAELPDRIKALLSGYLRNNPAATLDRELVRRAEAGDIAKPSVAERLDNVLRWVVQHTIEFGAAVEVDADRDFPLFYCSSADELRELCEALQRRGYVETSRLLAGSDVKVLEAGFERVESLPRGHGSQGFIAMAFADEVKEVGDAIDRAILAAGYVPKRIDRHPTTRPIVDEIITQIRLSRFVVADLAGDRGGVYYEAGFAEGIGLEVFFTADQDVIDEKERRRAHFDVRHRQLIGWRKAGLEDFERRLATSITSVVGPGPRFMRS